MIFNPEGVAACSMTVLSSKGINHESIFPNATVTTRWAWSSVPRNPRDDYFNVVPYKKMRSGWDSEIA
jgi:hypothetical protein